MKDASSTEELVSVIIPACNAAAFIADTLASALAQTYRSLEVVVVDDGSTDATADVVAAVAARDSRVCLLRQQNRGVAAARNLGIERCRGTLIAPLDADDLWHPDKIARQVAAMDRGGPSVGMVYAWSSLIDEKNRVVVPAGHIAHHEGDVFPFLVIHNFVGNASVPLLRRDHVREVGGYDPGLRARGGEGCEDLMLYLRIAERYDVALVPALLVGYRINASNMSNSLPQMQRGHDLVLESVRARHPELPRRMYRWATSFNCIYLARRSLRRGRPLSAIRFIGRALAQDPGALFEPPFQRTLAGLLARFSDGTGAVNGVTFPDLCRQAGASAVPKMAAFSRRRHAFLKALAGSSRRNEAMSQSLTPTDSKSLAVASVDLAT